MTLGSRSMLQGHSFSCVYSGVLLTSVHFNINIILTVYLIIVQCLMHITIIRSRVLVILWCGQVQQDGPTKFNAILID